MNLLLFVLVLFFSLSVAFLMIAFSYFFGPRIRTPIKEENFECGMPQAMPTKNTISINFYTLAVVFLIFDIELVLIYPWIWGFDVINNTGFVVGLVFCFLILLTTIYIIKRKAIEWE